MLLHGVEEDCSMFTVVGELLRLIDKRDHAWRGIDLGLENIWEVYSQRDSQTGNIKCCVFIMVASRYISNISPQPSSSNLKSQA